MLTAHASCMAVLPSPVSAKIAARPLRSAHEVNEAGNGYSDGGSEHSVRPTPDHSRRLLARNDSYAHEPSHSSRQYDVQGCRGLMSAAWSCGNFCKRGIYTPAAARPPPSADVRARAAPPSDSGTGSCRRGRAGSCHRDLLQLIHLALPACATQGPPMHGHTISRREHPPHTLRDGLCLELRQTLGDVPGDAALDEEDAGLAGFDREHVKGSEQILPNACVGIEMFDDGGQTPALTQRGERARGRASHSPTSPAGATSRARRGRRGSRGQGQGARGRRARGGSASPRPLPHAEILRPLGRVVAHAPLDRHLLVEHADASRLRLLDRRPRTRLIAILVAAIRAALTADDEPVERLHRVTLLWIFRVCRRVDSDAPKNVHAPGVMDAR